MNINLSDDAELSDFLESPVQYQKLVNVLQRIIKSWSSSHVILIHSSANLFLLYCHIGSLVQEQLYTNQ